MWLLGPGHRRQHRDSVCPQHQAKRLYWDFGQILEASIYLEELVKQTALRNPLMRTYNPGQDDQPEPHEDPSREQGGFHTDHANLGMDGDQCERDDKGTPATDAKQHQWHITDCRFQLLGSKTLFD